MQRAGILILRVMVIFICVAPCCTFSALAQTKSGKSTKKTPDTTVIYVDESDKAPKVTPGFTPRSDMKEKVVIINLSDTAPKVRPTYKDTVIIIKKGPGKEKMAEMRKAKAMEEVRNNNYCNCVKMDIKVSPELQYEAYLNYDFIFKNNCKIDVWVSSKHFRFIPYHAMGGQVKVLRKLSFVQRYGHPDFVKIAPGETYTFNNSDDAFFEYDLKKGYNYKFIFEHRNFGDRAKRAPEKTYLCGQKRTQMISVK